MGTGFGVRFLIAGFSSNVLPRRSCIAARCTSVSLRYGRSCLYVERSAIRERRSAMMFFFPSINLKLMSNFDRYVTDRHCRGDRCFCFINDNIACESVIAVKDRPISQCS